MKHLTHLAASAVFALLVAAPAFGAGDAWLTSYDAAVKQAKKTGKPIMADFTGSDWCTWCMKLHQEVFSKPEFKKWAAKNVILLEVDFPHQTPQAKSLVDQNMRLERKYHDVLPGFPTVLFMNADGTVFGKYGYDEGGPDRWTHMASRLLPLQKPAGKQAKM
ncbi:MAG: thioredoxin family protein [Fimbriimonas sp.]|nr:thioredoxin family protein [Fimbriimonas sp.]